MTNYFNEVNYFFGETDYFFGETEWELLLEEYWYIEGLWLDADQYYQDEVDDDFDLFERMDALREEVAIREAIKAEHERREEILDLLDVIEDAATWNFYHSLVA